MPGANRELFHAGHYAVIAKRIREARAVYAPQSENDTTAIVAQAALDMVCRDLASWFSEDNPRFESDTWYEATNTNMNGD